MRVAVLSDVHGNAVALRAVVAEAQAAGVDAYWVVGDLVANGPQPAEVLGLVRSLPGLVAVRGNTDRYVLTGDMAGMIPSITQPTTEHEWRLLVDATSAHAWTRGCVTTAGHRDWLGDLPLEARPQLPDGTRVLLVHASPGRDDGSGVGAATSPMELSEQGWARCRADLAFVGHTHQPTVRHFAGVAIVNLGSVGLSPSPGAATWTLVDAGTSRYTLEHRETAYDVADVRAALVASHHPTMLWLAHKLHVD